MQVLTGKQRILMVACGVLCGYGARFLVPSAFKDSATFVGAVLGCIVVYLAFKPKNL